MRRENLNVVLATCAVAFVLIFFWGATNKTSADRVVAEATKRLADKYARRNDSCYSDRAAPAGWIWCLEENQ